MKRNVFFLAMAALFLLSAVIFYARENRPVEASGTAKAVIAVK